MLLSGETASVGKCKQCLRFELFDVVSDTLLLIDAASGRLLYMNEKARELYGYSREEVASLMWTDVVHRAPEQHAYIQAVQAHKAGLAEVARHRRKNGELFRVQVSTRYLELQGQAVLVSTVRDVTPEVKLREEVLLAQELQRGLLPPDLTDESIVVRSVYQPYRHISGDFFGYTWRSGEQKLFGYLIDVMGHGISAALQTSSSRVLFQQVATAHMSLTKKMAWINRCSQPYLAEDSLVAAICFEMDLARQRMHCVSAGIHCFCVLDANGPQLVKLPGSFLGIDGHEYYGECMIPFAPGDSFFFLSDGLYDMLPPEPASKMSTFEDAYQYLKSLAKSEHRRDDASALCVQARVFPL